MPISPRQDAHLNSLFIVDRDPKDPSLYASIFFSTGNDSLDVDAIGALNALIRWFQFVLVRKRVFLTVTGNADWRDTDIRNFYLSQRRARRVADYIEKGLANYKSFTVTLAFGLGETQALQGIKDADLLAYNRRVDVRTNLENKTSQSLKRVFVPPVQTRYVTHRSFSKYNIENSYQTDPAGNESREAVNSLVTVLTGQARYFETQWGDENVYSRRFSMLPAGYRVFYIEIRYKFFTETNGFAYIQHWSAEIKYFWHGPPFGPVRVTSFYFIEGMDDNARVEYKTRQEIDDSLLYSPVDRT